ncbi:hydroxymethylglutaryl-CoA lyase [Bosea sp. CCNWLW174]|uniref:hydroxymethylglutaryl-CoA lyase n=1 Tax=unclassified Bosea (in: a-proteobacteria) TaxID=2653178 RepID=UPI00301440D4
MGLLAPPNAHRIARTGLLDLYDLRTEISQQLAAEWPGQQLAHLDDAEIGQRTATRGIPSFAHRFLPNLSRQSYVLLDWRKPACKLFLPEVAVSTSSNIIEIVEVAPRDGLQNEPVFIPTAIKRELISRAVAAGIRRIETTSFVNPKRVPQMADADVLSAELRGYPGLSSIGLVMNERGMERAAAHCSEINFVAVASETFSQRNQGASIAQTLASWREVSGKAREAGLRTTVTIGASFGCPFEGEVAPVHVLRLVEQILETRPDEIAFADTIGCGVPSQVRTLLAGARSLDAGLALRCHFHNTRNTALANVLVAVEAGVGAIDASIGGVGGCPFAPKATGNVATEDVVYMLERMGIRTGVLLDALIETANWLAPSLANPIQSGLARAGLFPANALAV